MSTLKTPVFNDQGMFNREGKQIRVELVKELPNGLKLWQKAGKPENDYPNADNDQYYLMVEIGGYVASLGVTEWRLEYSVGRKQAEVNLYGGEAERGKAFDNARNGKYDAETTATINAMIKREEEETRRIGSNPALQAQAVQNWIDERSRAYRESRDNGGKTFPDFIGAIYENDLENCFSLRDKYSAAQEVKAKVAQEKRKQEERERKAANLASDESALDNAVSIITNGGKIENDALNNGNLFVLLFKRYNVELPIKIKGYIMKKLASVTFSNGRATTYSYLKTSKAQKGSTTLYYYLHKLENAIQAANAPEATDDELNHLFGRKATA